MKPILRRKVYSISMEPLLLLHNACVNFGLIDVILHADTVPPTAVVDGGAAFTHALNATVNITFSETCDHGGGFVCTNTSFCDVSYTAIFAC